MNVIDYLMIGDPVIQRLTRKYLLGERVTYSDDGYIGRYIDLFDMKKGLWCNAVYSKKWISTHYTLLELMYMEIRPSHKVYQRAIKVLLHRMWDLPKQVKKRKYQDMCVSGMMMSMACYGKIKDPKMDEIVNYMLINRMTDGGWNCGWDQIPPPSISSVHTTMTMLEAIRDYLKNGYTYNAQELEKAMQAGIEVLLERELFKSFKDGTPLYRGILNPTYPPRWKYDTLRALEFLASIKYPYDPRMDEALDDLKKHMKGPLVRRGSQHSGLTHFQLEDEAFGRFNTLRMLKVLKQYDKAYYNYLLTLEI